MRYMLDTNMCIYSIKNQYNRVADLNIEDWVENL